MGYRSPKEVTEHFSESGIYKSSLPLPKFAIISIFGGAFIAFGALLSIMVAGGMPGIGAENPGLIRLVAAALFPVGLIMVSFTGSDLFTGDCTGFTLPLLQKKIKVSVFFKYLCLSYIFNFIGTQIIAYFFANGTGIISHSPWSDYLLLFSENKVHQDWGTVFLKGIGANWLVCLGVWMGYASKDIVGKCIGIWIPIMLFVTLGYEHSIANMFFIPTAIYAGADILWIDFISKNLIPSTLGNIIGGMVFIGCTSWYLYMYKAEE